MIYIDGCSFSRYYWPTWADIIQHSNQHVINIAESGSGNERIFFNLMQNLHRLQPGCKVILQWSSFPRFDYWHQPMVWEAKGNRYYVGDFVEKSKEWWSDGYLMFKTYHYVTLARKLLTEAGVDFYFMTMDNWKEYQTRKLMKLGLNWHTIIDDDKMILHDMKGHTASDQKYFYSAEWVPQGAFDDHPSIESQIHIASLVNEHLKVKIDNDYVEKLKGLHIKLKQIDEVTKLQDTARPFKSQKTNIY